MPEMRNVRRTGRSILVEGLEARQLLSVSYGANLIVNPGAETYTGTADGTTVITPAGWTSVGNPTIDPYSSGDGVSTAHPKPPNTGNVFFYGGMNSTTDSGDFFQTIDLSSIAAAIDAKQVKLVLSAYLGGWDSQDDDATVFINFQNSSKGFISQTSIGPVEALERGDNTGMISKSITGTIPALTRFAQVQLHLKKWGGGDNDGMADNLSLILTGPAVTAPEASVLGNSVEIIDGDTTPSTTDATDFGSVAINATAPTKIFTIKNTGTAALTTSGLTAPTGFSIVEGLSSSIATGGSDTITIKLNTTTAGTFQGNLSFANNDSNENPYNFTIKGVVTAPTLPTVSIAATDATATEPISSSTTATDTGLYTITRTGSTTAALVVNLGFTGTATNGTDYVSIPTTVTIPSGAASTTIKLTPKYDGIVESTETAIVALGSSTAYTADAAKKYATVNIINTNPVATGSISGLLFHDFNGSSTQDTGDSVLGGWTVFLDKDNDGILDTGEPSKLTDANGGYSFTALTNGAYRVRPVLKSGWLNVSSAYTDVTVAGAAITARNFAIARPVTISGNVFNDTNRDGFKDTGETGLSAWKLFIDADNDGVLDAGEKTATTDASGNYAFTGLKPGTFSVRLIVNAGATATTPVVASIALRSGMTGAGMVFGAKV